MKPASLGKILVAETDPDSFLLLKSLIEEMGFEVIAAGDGQQARNHLRKNEIKMVIATWATPGFSYSEIFGMIRESDLHPRPYIIVIASSGRNQDIAASLATGADDYVYKPIDPHQLQARVKIGQRFVDTHLALADRINELQQALSHSRAMEGLLPICSCCHKIRDSREGWHQLETYIMNRSAARFTHSLCPDCRKQHYPV